MNDRTIKILSGLDKSTLISLIAYCNPSLKDLKDFGFNFNSEARSESENNQNFEKYLNFFDITIETAIPLLYKKVADGIIHFRDRDYRSVDVDILVHVTEENQKFSEVILFINDAKKKLKNVRATILICKTVSEEEIGLFNKQGIRVYTGASAQVTGETLVEKLFLSDSNTKNQIQVSNQGINAPYQWNGLYFRSQTEIKIAEALDRANVLFFPNNKARLMTSQGMENRESDFLVFYQGKWGIIEVDGEPYHPASRTVDDHERDRLFKIDGIRIVEHYDATRCWNNPDDVVQEFLEILRQA